MENSYEEEKPETLELGEGDGEVDPEPEPDEPLIPLEPSKPYVPLTPLDPSEERDRFATHTVKLRVHETRVFKPFYRTTSFAVKNEGGGDAYVSDNSLRLTKFDRLRPGETLYIQGNEGILLRSANRPLLTIKQYI